jgi:GNAT superfamily N-acetyltransferase
MAQLVMKRPAGGPVIPAASVRAATPSDAEALGRLLGAAFPEMDWSAERARKDLLEASDVKATFVIDEDDKLLATASARYFTARFPEGGYVHWVAVDPAARGRGLFDVVMAAVHRQFDADGKPVAFLETDDQRLPAIAAYLRLGYVPHYTESDHESRWSKIFTQLAEGRRGKH